jgi:hypothetical protein
MATESVSSANKSKGNYILYYALIADQVLVALLLSYLMIDSDESFN